MTDIEQAREALEKVSKLYSSVSDTRHTQAEIDTIRAGAREVLALLDGKVLVDEDRLDMVVSCSRQGIRFTKLDKQNHLFPQFTRYPDQEEILAYLQHREEITNG